MRRMVMFLAVLLVALPMTGCTRVEPGWVGIKVNMYGTQKGVEDFPLQTGRVTFNPITEEVYKFPTFMQNFVWTRDNTEGSKNNDEITFNSVEGAVVSADIAVGFLVSAEKVPDIFVEFRKPIEEIRDVYIRSQVRDAFGRHASTMKVTDIFGEGKQKLLDAVKEDLNNLLSERGISFDMISFVGGLRVDPRVQESINAVLSAAQKAIEAENKVRQSTAEARQMVEQARGDSLAAVINAAGQAEANRVLMQSLTPQLIQYETMRKWNGVLPTVTGGSVPMITVPGGR